MIRKFANFLLFFADYNSGKVSPRIGKSEWNQFQRDVPLTRNCHPILVFEINHDVLLGSDESLFCTPDEEPDMEVPLHDYLVHIYNNFEVDNEYSAMIIPQALICKLQNTDQLTFTRRNMHR